MFERVKQQFNNLSTRQYALIIGVLLLIALGIYTGWMISRPPVPAQPAADGSTARPAKIKPVLPRKMSYKEMFQTAAQKYNLDWQLLEALAYQESRMNYLAVSSTDDQGLMQISPPTWDEWAAKIDVDDPFDPYSNILVGAAYLAFVRDLCTDRGHSEPHCMLVAYTWGPNRLERFFANGGLWQEIPAAQRNYAINIVNMANTRRERAAFFEEIYASIAEN